MDQRSAEGTEFVLDNRKLIIVFLLLISVCGAFFVIGFMEGKRQSVQLLTERSPAATETGSAAGAAAPDAATAPVKTAGPPVGAKSVRDQLDWYKNVQGGAGDASKAADAAKPAPGAQKAPGISAKTVKPARPTPGSMVPAENVTYSVQVGAFRQRREAEAKTDLLKAKGFQGVIESSQTGDPLFLVKVGRFKSRVDAAATQIQLRKAGFKDCFVKTN